MSRNTYLCPNCRAPATFGKKFCCNCGVRFQWAAPLTGKQLTSVSCNTQPVSAQNLTASRLPVQEEPESQSKSGWDKPQSYSHKPSALNAEQSFQQLDGSKSAIQEKNLSAGSGMPPVKVSIIKMLEHLLDKQASCN